MDSVKCPHCGKQVELSEAIVHELQQQVRDEESKKLKAQFEEEKAKERAQQEKRLREEFEEESKQKEKDLKQLEEKIEALNKDREKNEERIREEAAKDARLEKLELEKKLKDTQEALEDAQRKSKQGSQQLQGEVLELDLEDRLRQAFTGDEFLPVPKGVEGADIWQKVRFNGRVVGSIIWETKRTKAWSKSWLIKLKEDAGKVSATEAILVSSVLPDGVSSFDRREGVWITTYDQAISLCRMIRFLITSVASAKSSASHSEEEWAAIRDYMTSDSFKHRMQAHFDAVNSLRVGLDAEKRATILRWKKQETQIEKLDTNTTNFYAELQSIVPNLPKIEGVGLLEEGSEDEETTLF